MYPVLFRIPLFGGLPIHTYGVLVAIGFLVGMWWVSYEAKRVGEDPARATDLVFYIIIAAIVGSRLMYMLVTDRAHLLAQPLSLFKIWEGGLTFYGGLIGALVVAIWFTRHHRRSFWTYADIFAPGIALGHAFGRLGCLAVGCCHGLAADAHHWWTLTFPTNPDGIAPPGVPLYPTQLLEAVGAFCLFLILVAIRRWALAPGRLFAMYLVGYGCLRFGVEFWRSESSRDFLFTRMLSVGQGISLVALVGAVVLWLMAGRRKHG